MLVLLSPPNWLNQITGRTASQCLSLSTSWLGYSYSYEDFHAVTLHTQHLVFWLVHYVLIVESDDSMV